MDDFSDFNGDSLDSSITGKQRQGTVVQMGGMAPNAPKLTEAQILKPLISQTAADKSFSDENSSSDSGPVNLSILRDSIAEQKQSAIKKVLSDHYTQLANQNPTDDFSDFSGASIHADVSKLPADTSTPANPAVSNNAVQDTRSITGNDDSDRQLGEQTAPMKSPGFDFLANQASSIGSTIAGGYAGMYKGLKTLYQSGDKEQALSDAVDTIHNTQEQGTFVPRTQMGQQMVDKFNSPYNPLMLPVTASSAAGNAVGDTLANHGMPGAGAIVKGLGAAAPLALGFKGVQDGFRNLNELAPASEIAKPANRYDIVPPVEKPAYKLVNGKPELINDGIQVPPITPPIAPRAILENASPELQQKVQADRDSNSYINEAALTRHIEAETLHVPVKITEGQAALDPSLISNEMNGRGKVKPTVSPDFYNAQGKALGKNLDVVRSNLLRRRFDQGLEGHLGLRPGHRRDQERAAGGGADRPFEA